MKDLEVQEEDEGGHGGIPDDRAGIDDPFGEVLHVLDGGDIGEEIFDGGRGDIEDFGEEADEEEKGDGGERNGGGVNLVFGESGGEAADGTVEATD